MSRLMITAAPETNRWNEGQLIPETLISAMAQLVGEAETILSLTSVWHSKQSVERGLR
jgi:hypothetical protein